MRPPDVKDLKDETHNHPPEAKTPDNDQEEQNSG